VVYSLVVYSQVYSQVYSLVYSLIRWCFTDPLVYALIQFGRSTFGACVRRTIADSTIALRSDKERGWTLERYIGALSNDGSALGKPGSASSKNGSAIRNDGSALRNDGSVKNGV
jgi:hypothetical protein